MMVFDIISIGACLNYSETKDVLNPIGSAYFSSPWTIRQNGAIILSWSIAPDITTKVSIVSWF